MSVAAAVVLAVLALVAGTRRGSLGPAGTPAQSPGIELAPSSFGDLRFAVSYPKGWRLSRQTVEEGRVLVRYRDPGQGTADAPTRAFDVLPERVSIADARPDIEDSTRKQAGGAYRKIAITEGLSVAGHAAFRHEFFDGNLRFDQWWIERPGGSFRVTFWEPADQEAAAAHVNQRVLGTFREL